MTQVARIVPYLGLEMDPSLPTSNLSYLSRRRFDEKFKVHFYKIPWLNTAPTVL